MMTSYNAHQSPITHEHRLAAEEHAEYWNKVAELKSIVLNRGLDKETRLAAMMAIDALIWGRRRGRVEQAIDGVPDKIVRAKNAAERKRLERLRIERIMAGLPIRPRVPVGAWHSTEASDKIVTPTVCAWCGKPYDIFSRPRSRMCSRHCAQAAYVARKAFSRTEQPQKAKG